MLCTLCVRVCVYVCSSLCVYVLCSKLCVHLSSGSSSSAASCAKAGRYAVVFAGGLASQSGSSVVSLQLVGGG